MAKRRPDRLTALRSEVIQTRGALDAKIDSTRQALDAKIDTVRDELRAEIQRGTEETRRQAEESRRQADETRRHFEVIAEGLRSQIQLVAEAVLSSNETRERFAGDVDSRFRVVDGRLLRLEGRVFGSPAP